MTRFIIHGSCVTRDTFGFLPADHELVWYAARQSAISAGRPVAGLAARLPTLPSAFQDRVVRSDIAGNVLKELSSRLVPGDVLLLDLVDERGGVLEFPGGYVTKLSEFWSNGGQALSRAARHIALGTPEHFALWKDGIDRVLSQAASAGIGDRVAFLQTPWASTLDDGSPLEVPEWMLPPAEANRIYQPYFDHLVERGETVLALPSELAVSTEHHRWGPSPFHYGDEAYRWLASEITDFCERTSATPA